MSYFGQGGSSGSPFLARRRTFRPGILAVIAAGAAATIVALSRNVRDGNVAAAERHIDEAHPVVHGVVICRAPCPGAVALLEPPSEPARRPAVISSA